MKGFPKQKKKNKKGKRGGIKKREEPGLTPGFRHQKNSKNESQTGNQAVQVKEAIRRWETAQNSQKG